VSRARLPGGLDAWRARWLLSLAGGAGGACDRSGVPVTAQGQPGLHRLAGQAAKGAGAAVPDVWLAGEPQVSVHAGRRPCVHIGLPLVHALSEVELAGLVAYHLAPRGFARPRLVKRLHGAWHEAREAAAGRVALGRRPKRRHAALRAGAARFADKVDRYADAVPVPLLGLRRTALMFARAELVSLEFTGYLATVAGWALDRGYAVTDLHDGWRRYLRLGGARGQPAGTGARGQPAGTGGHWHQEAAEEVAARHPRLAQAIMALDADSVVLAPPPAPDPPQETVELSPLAPAVQRRLARAALGPLAGWRRLRWLTLDEVPPDVWRQQAVEQAAGVTADVARLLGRQPTGTAEVVAVLTTRTKELAAAPALLAVFEGTLLARGWRRADPVLPGVLVSPTGDVVDGRSLDAAALAEVVAAAG
jgi:hypothetical protein